MAWIRVDDQMPDHPKVAPLSDAAFRWIFRGLSYANRFLTNGVLPPAFLDGVPPPVKEELMTAVVWTTDRSGRVRIHDYHDYQPSKAAVKRRRKGNRERQQRFRDRVSNDVTRRNGVTNSAPSRPVPARPDQYPLPPATRGPKVSKRKPTAEELKRAEMVLRNSGCPHDPKCDGRDVCIGRMVYVWRHNQHAGMTIAEAE